MARQLRIQRENTWYHVMSRANGVGDLYLDDTDRRRFLGLLSELPGRYRIEIHAFVLMPNHYHLLLRTRDANLSPAMKWLNVSYTTRFNWAHGREGHVLSAPV